MITFYKNGNIHTMDDSKPIADTLIVEDETFTYVGNEQGALEFLKNSNKEYEVVDLKNNLVLPGFNDSHMHFVNYAKSKEKVNLTGTKSISEIRSRLKEKLSSSELDSMNWLEGIGWNHDYFTDEKRFPNKFDLDDITGEIPTLIVRTCFHIGVLNSAGIKALGLNKETARQLYGDQIDFLPDGELSGIVKENLMGEVKSFILSSDKTDLKEILKTAQYDAFAQGLTSVHSDDIGYSPNNNYDVIFNTFKELNDSNDLHLRIGEQCLLKDESVIKEFFDKNYGYGFGNNQYRVASIKILTDGSLGARTAALRQPYNDDPETCGIQMFTQDELNAMLLAAHTHGCPVAVHAIGDKAIEMALDSIEYAKKSDPSHSPRHGIVHSQITDEKLLNRMKELNVLALIQPIFIDYDMNIVYDRVGKELANTSYAWKTMINKGIHVSFGTDCPVESFNTMKNIYSAVTRKNITGDQKKTYLPNEKLSMEESIKAYTIGGAYASGEENIKGTITSGKLADFILLDKDLFNLTSDEEILDTNILETYIGGKKVYSK